MIDESPRDLLHRAIQGSRTEDTTDELNGAMLRGWVLVSEWVDGSGRTWLSMLDGDANGENLPNWIREGYLHNTLHHADDFQEPDEDG